MASRQEIQEKLATTLAAGEEKFEQMKADMEKAGDNATQESKEALASAQSSLENGKQKLDDLASASDEQFDELMDKAKDGWDDLSSQVESGWASASEKIKGLFS